MPSKCEEFLAEVKLRECEALHPMRYPGDRKELRACAEDVPKLVKMVDFAIAQNGQCICERATAYTCPRCELLQGLDRIAEGADGKA